MTRKWTVRVVVLSVVLLGGVHYGTLDNPVLAPDAYLVFDNYYLQNPILASQLFVSGGRAERVQELYEPAEDVLLATGRSLWGDDPRGFRILSLVLQAAAAVLLFLVLSRFGVSAPWSALGALIFAVHPINTQAVDVISSGGHILSSALTLGAILAFSTPLLRAAQSPHPARPRGSWLAVLLFALGLFSGLEGLVFVAFCCFLPVLLEVKFPRPRFYAAVAAVVAVYVVMAVLAVGSAALGIPQGNWGAAAAVKAVEMVFFPTGQMIFHPMEYVGSWANGRSLAGLVLVLALGAVAVSLRVRARALSLAVGFTACSLLVFFLGGVRSGELREPGLFMLSGGACAVLAALAVLLSRVRGERPIVLALMITLVAAGAVRSWQRCAVWADPEEVWLEVLKAHPGEPHATDELARYYRDSGMSDKAAALFSPKTDDAMSRAVKLNNEGVAMRDSGRLYASVAKFREALGLWPDFRDAYFNLGVVFYRMKMPDSAAANLERAITEDPDYAEARYNLGVVYDSIGDYERAEFQYREAIRLNPNSARALANLGADRARAGDFEDAIKLLNEAVKIDPGLLQARFNLALAYEKVDVEKAKEEWRAYVDLARNSGVPPARIQQAEERMKNLK